MSPKLPAEEPSDEFIRVVATLQVTLDRIAANQEGFKAELRGVGPRLDALAARQEALSADITKLADRIHTASNLMVKSIDAAMQAHEGGRSLDHAFELLESETRLRFAAFERDQRRFEAMVDVLEARVQRLRDSLIPSPDELNHTADRTAGEEDPHG